LINYLIASKANPKGSISDTRAMAMLLSKLGVEYLGQEKFDRFVVFDAKQTRLWGDWEIDNGALFSHSGYKSYKSSFKVGGK
jgi:hypothetical protein